jgi:hypothetical protein
MKKRLASILDNAKGAAIDALKMLLLMKKNKELVLNMEIDGFTYRSIFLSKHGDLFVRSIFLGKILDENIEGCSYKVLYSILDHIDSY